MVSWNFFEFKVLSILTMFAFALGTSIPMVPLPGIGAMIRMPRTPDSRRCHLQILDLRDTYAFCRLDFVECDGRTNRSTDGFDLYAKVAQHLDDAVLLARCSSSSMDTPSSSYFFRRLSTGYLYLVNGSFGLIGVFSTSALLKVLPVAFSSAVATEMSIPICSEACSSLGALLFQCFLFSPFCTEFALTCNE